MRDSTCPARRPGGVILTAVIAVFLLGLASDRMMQPATAAGGDTKALAQSLIEKAGIDRGVCAILGCDGDVAIQLVRSSKLLTLVRDPEAGAVAELRAKAEEAGLTIDQLVVEQGYLDKLPFADNFVDLVLATGLSADQVGQLSLPDIIRALRPEGTAIIRAAESGMLTEEQIANLKGACRQGGAEQVSSWNDAAGTWFKFSKPPMEGIDEWSHWEHGPDNNPVSTDSAIKAPYMTQFLGTPWRICMPSITTAAGGRTFLATGHIAHHRKEWDTVTQLIGRNGYNGTILWQRDLPLGYLSHRSAFVATKDTFYMIDGDACLMLDPETGDEKGRIRIPGTEGDWKWMVKKENVLYVLAGERGGKAKVILGDRSFGGWSWADLSVGYYDRPRVRWGFGHTLAAYDLEKEKVLWTHKEDDLIDSRGMAMRDGKLFLYCPEKHLRCLNDQTGEVLWTNTDSEVSELVEEPGKGLVSTPGFRSACITVATDDALIIQGQTRMNVVAVSTQSGSLLWTKKKFINNPNAIFLDGKVIVGLGERGSHVMIDPVSGEVLEDLKFRKTACTRLTASADSLFVRGEGTLRMDRKTKKVLVDGAARPSCNDGALPANGMLYLGPWGCDCNLSLFGAVGKCSAGDFRFDVEATDAGRLGRGEGDVNTVADFEVTEGDWPTYRANIQRSASTSTKLARPNPAEDAPRVPQWAFAPPKPCIQAPPVSAGGVVFLAATDGKVRALDAATGGLRWEFATAGPIKASVNIADGRAYVGSGDGNVYCLEAATGRLLWKFRAAPAERKIFVYDYLTSTWPVNSGVLVHDGVAYFAAGIIDYDGTYVFAVDAATGKIKWQNNSSGHLSDELRKGVSAQGNLTILGDELLLAGGNQVTPARFNLETGECANQPYKNPGANGRPIANHGKFVGVLAGKYSLAGGRTLYSDPKNVANKDSFILNGGKGQFTLNMGGIPPAWNDDALVMVNFARGKLTCCDAAKLRERIEEGYSKDLPPAQRRRLSLSQVMEADGGVRWTSDLNEPNKFEALSIAVCPNSVVAAVQFQTRNRAQPQWSTVAFDTKNGNAMWFWRHNLPGEPLPGGLIVGRQGQVILAMLDGSVLSLAPKKPPTPRGQTDRPRPAARK